ncbi:hypothetical protein V6N13_070381 [Hibiscus sabdariffa]|uniref:Uncharacterized protein n=1 Tax=Hibiscus sabdariffa TaxID=183260 RepID=A0ABR2THI0_9ROSI
MSCWEDEAESSTIEKTDYNTGLRHSLSSLPVNYMNAFGISFADVGPIDVDKAIEFLDLAMAEEESLESSDYCDSDVELSCWNGTYVPPPLSEVFPMKFSDVVKLPPRKPCESSRMTSENGIVVDKQLDAKARSFHEKTISGEEPVSGCNVSLVIDTMHNLSRFLLNHCSNGTCVLSDQDVFFLEEVILNLDKSISTNIGQELHSDLRLGINMGCLQVKMDKTAQDNASCLVCCHKTNIEMEKAFSDNETDALDVEKSAHKLATEANHSPMSGQSPRDMLANDAEEWSDCKDFHLCSEHDGTTQSPIMTGDEDDWEHVSMEELSELNSSC